MAAQRFLPFLRWHFKVAVLEGKTVDISAVRAFAERQ
jgi:hypothetical protein